MNLGDLLAEERVWNWPVEPQGGLSERMSDLGTQGSWDRHPGRRQSWGGD